MHLFSIDRALRVPGVERTPTIVLANHLPDDRRIAYQCVGGSRVVRGAIAFFRIGARCDSCATASGGGLCNADSSGDAGHPSVAEHRAHPFQAQFNLVGATAILSAIIALEEAEPARLRGYGELSADDAHAVTLFVTQIDNLLDKMASYFAQGPGAGLRERLEKLSSTTDEANLLRRLERLITRRGLVEFRGALEMLLDRIASDGFEVAVFGRVSSGKSSLLNYVLNTETLPVGVTPVTTVPTRIVYGPEPRATVAFAERQSQRIPPDQISEFASERMNPGNAKHVTRILVELPAHRLQEGVMLVDTPGIGSLALSGAVESMAYLPRCDVGIVLIDAASTLVAEDVALVDLLYRAGAAVHVLLSKADMLTDAEHRQSVEYVREQLRKQTGMDVPTFAVSVRDKDSALCDQWLEVSLSPTLAKRQQMARESLRRKVGMLRNSVAAASGRR